MARCWTTMNWNLLMIERISWSKLKPYDRPINRKKTLAFFLFLELLFVAVCKHWKTIMMENKRVITFSQCVNQSNCSALLSNEWKIKENDIRLCTKCPKISVSSASLRIWNFIQTSSFFFLWLKLTDYTQCFVS